MVTEETIILALTGSNSAWSIIRRSIEKVSNIVVNKIIFDRSYHDDIKSEIFIRIRNNLLLYDPEKASFETWCNKISENYCKAFIIKLKRKRDNDSAYQSSSISTSLCFNDFTELYVEEIKDYISKIASESHNIVLVLRFIDEYKYKEIAEEQSMSINTVKSIIKKYKNKIHQFVRENLMCI